MHKNKQGLKVGDLVRISRTARTAFVRAPFGVVGTVSGFSLSSGSPCVLDGNERGGISGWYIPAVHLKLAKQAMRKRDEYAARR